MSHHSLCLLILNSQQQVSTVYRKSIALTERFQKSLWKAEYEYRQFDNQLDGIWDQLDNKSL